MRIAIIGAGQVGGALGRDIALNAPLYPEAATDSSGGKSLFVENITYYDINRSHVAEMKKIAGEVAGAREKNVIDVMSDEHENEFRRILRKADIVIVAVGGDQIGPVTAQFAADLKPGAVYSDTASVKVPAVADIQRELQATGRSDIIYIWIHPGTGTADSGPSATKIGVYNKNNRVAVFIDEPDPAASEPKQQARQVMEWLLTIQNAQIEPATAERQDQFFAVASGFHHVTAYTLMDMARDGDGNTRSEYKFAGTALRNTTRITASEPGMVVPLLAGHKENIPRILPGFVDQMERIADAIRRKDVEALTVHLDEARRFRLTLAPKDTVPRESIEGDIHDFRKLSAPAPDSFARGVLLPYVVGYAETLNAQMALQGIAFERFPNPSFLDGSAPVLNDPRRVAQLIIENRDELLPVMGQFTRLLHNNVWLISQDDRSTLGKWTSDTRAVRKNAMPPPRRAVSEDKATPDNDAVRPEFLLSFVAAEPAAVSGAAAPAAASSDLRL